MYIKFYIQDERTQENDRKSKRVIVFFFNLNNIGDNKMIVKGFKIL